ncbi:hypothetical protein NW828_13240 [Synechococcus sp. W55.2]
MQGLRPADAIGSHSPPLANPSMVVMAWPCKRAAGYRQLWTGSPSNSTVQAPQSPESQARRTPTQPSSRNKLSRVIPGGTTCP